MFSLILGGGNGHTAASLDKGGTPHKYFPEIGNDVW